MNSTKKLASGVMSGLLCVQALLAVAAIAATLLKERPHPLHSTYQTAMASDDLAWR
jgi:hypothetical protein